MTEKEFNKNIRTSILGEYMNNEKDIAVVFFDFDESKQELIAGTCTNFGIKPLVSVNYDNNMHIDSNIEMLHEMLTEIGFVLVD